MKFKILTISGSLREKSYNTLCLQTLKKYFPETVNYEIFEKISEIPPYNQDEEGRLPEVVQDLKSKVENSDVIIFSTPEYNHSFSGVIKNTLDWISRPAGKNSLQGKYTAILGASTGFLGTVRAQMHLRTVLRALKTKVINKTELLIGQVHKKFDDQRELIDDETKEWMKQFVKEILETLKE